MGNVCTESNTSGINYAPNISIRNGLGLIYSQKLTQGRRIAQVLQGVFCLYSLLDILTPSAHAQNWKLGAWSMQDWTFATSPKFGGLDIFGWPKIKNGYVLIPYLEWIGFGSNSFLKVGSSDEDGTSLLRGILTIFLSQCETS